jgi:trk system potassium uptake protein
MIDQSPELVERVQEELDVMAYCGHGASLTVLDEAGMSQANMLIAVTNSDEIDLPSYNASNLDIS